MSKGQSPDQGGACPHARLAGGLIAALRAVAVPLAVLAGFALVQTGTWARPGTGEAIGTATGATAPAAAATLDRRGATAGAAGPMTLTIAAVPPDPPPAPAVSLVSRSGGTYQELFAEWSLTLPTGTPEVTRFDVDVGTGIGVLASVVQLGSDVFALKVSDGRHPVTNFTVRVRAANSVGPGLWSAAVTASQGSPPPTLTLTSAAPTAAEGYRSVEVSWRPSWPGYSTQVRYRPAPFTGAFRDTTATGQDTLTISGLESRTEYEIQARSFAISPAVYGSWTEATTVTTEAAPSDFPPRPTATVARRVPDGHDGLVVSWTVPDTTVTIDNFEVRYRRDSESYASVTVAGIETSATIDELAPSSSYNVQVRSSNDVGESLWHDAGWTQTDVAPVTLSIQGPVDTRVSEGSAVYFTVRREQTRFQVTVDVNYGGTAQKGTDFTGPDTVTLSRYRRSAQFRVSVINDDMFEPDETIDVSIENPRSDSTTGVDVASDTTVTSTIAGSTPTFRAGAPATVAEGETHTYSLDLNHCPRKPKQLHISYGGTAVRGQDFLAPDSVSIVPLAPRRCASATTTIPVSFISDWQGSEGIETLEIELVSLVVSQTETVTLQGGGRRVTTEVRDGPAIEATVPRRPTVTQVLPRQSNGVPALEVSWSVPAAPGMPTIISQEVRYRTEEDDETTTLTVAGSSTSAVISGLDGGVNHFVWIRAINSIGAGEWSSEFRRQTGTSPSQVGFTKPSYVATEGHTALVGIEVDTIPSFPVTVDLEYGGTASRGTHYVSNSTARIEAESGIAYLPLTLLPDAINEESETVIVTVLSPRSADPNQYSANPMKATTALTITASSPTDPTISFPPIRSITLNEGELYTMSLAVRGDLTQTLTLEHTQFVREDDIESDNGIDLSADVEEDLVVTPSALVIEPDAVSAELTISIVSDTEIEDKEKIYLRLTGLSGEGLDPVSLSTVSPTIWIRGNIPDFGPYYRRANVAEGDVYVIPLTMTGYINQMLTLDYETSGSATRGVDYTIDEPPLILRPGDPYPSITISVASDNLIESNERIAVKLTELSAVGSDVYDYPPRYYINPTYSFEISSQVPSISGHSYLSEGTSYHYRVNLKEAYPSPVTLDYTLGGDATPGIDYSASPPSPLVFDSSQTQATISIAVHSDSDSVAEPAETLDISLAGVYAQPNITSSFTTILWRRSTIAADPVAAPPPPPPPQPAPPPPPPSATLSLSASVTVLDPYSYDFVTTNLAAEGSRFNVVLEVPTAWQNMGLTLDAAYFGSATPGEDYSSLRPIRSFQGARSNIRITSFLDSDFEDSETIEIHLSNPRGAWDGTSVTLAGDTQITVTLAREDYDMSLTGTISEGENLPVTVVVTRRDTSVAETVTLSSPSREDGISIPGAELPFPVGVGEVSIALTPLIVDDEIMERDGTVALYAHNSSGERLRWTEAPIYDFFVYSCASDYCRELYAAIPFFDNDIASFLVSGPSDPVDEDDGTVLLTVTLDKSVGWNVHGRISSQGGNSDLVLPGYQDLIFVRGTPPGTPQFTRVTLIDDGAEEPAEEFEFFVFGWDGIATSQRGTLTIAANDPLSLALSGPPRLTEDAGAVAFTLWVLEGWGGVPLEISVHAVTRSTADSGLDYSLLSNGMVTVSTTLSPSGVPGGVFEISLTDDALVEGNETIELEIASVTGGSGLRDGTEPVRSTGLTVTVTDNDTPGAETSSPLDVDHDDEVDLTDSRIVFLAHQFKSHLGDGTSGSGDSVFRLGAFRDLLGATTPTSDADRRESLRRALALDGDSGTSIDGSGGFGWRDSLVANIVTLDPSLSALTPVQRDSALSLILGSGYPASEAARLVLIERARSLIESHSLDSSSDIVSGRTEKDATRPVTSAQATLRVKRTGADQVPVGTNPGPVTVGETVHVGLYLENDPGGTIPSFAGGVRIEGSDGAVAPAADLVRAFCDHDGLSGCGGVSTPGLQFLTPSDVLPDGIGAMLVDLDVMPPSVSCEPEAGETGCDIPVLVARLVTDETTPTGLFIISPSGLGTLGYSIGDYGGEVRTFEEPAMAEALTLEICPVAGCPPWGTLFANTVTVIEGGAALATVSLAYAADTTWSASLVTEAAQGPDAADHADFAPPASLVMGNGEDLGTLTVSTIDDEVDEGDEFMVLRLVEVGPNASGRATAATLSVTVVILDNDAPPVPVRFGSESIVTPATGDGWASYTAIEGEAAAMVTVLLDEPLDEVVVVSVTREYVGAGASAADISVSPLDGALTFAASQTMATLEIAAVDDAEDHNEEVRLGLGLPDPTPTLKLTLGDPPAGRVHLIEDSNRVVEILATGEDALTENPPSVATVSVRASLSIPPVGDQSVTIAVAGSADLGTDYTVGALPTLVIPGGTKESGTETVVLTALADGIAEIDEHVLLTAQVPGLGVAAATVTLSDDDTVEVAVGDGESTRIGAPVIEDPATFWRADVAEGETVAFTVSLSRTAAVGIDVPYTVSAGGDDVGAGAGTVTVPAGSGVGVIRLEVVDDLLAEGLETVQVSLGDPVSGLGGRVSVTAATGEAVIAASDLLRVTMDGPREVFAGEVASYRITLGGGVSSQPTTMTVVASGSAVEAAGSGPSADATITIAAGESEADYHFGTVPMTAAEAHTLVVEVGGISGGDTAAYVLGSSARVTALVAGTGLDINGDGNFNSLDARILAAAMTVGEHRLGNGFSGGFAGVRKQFFQSLLGDRDPGNDLGRRQMLRRVQAIKALPLFVTDIERDGDFDALDARLLYLLLRFEDQARGVDAGEPTGLVALLFRSWAGSNLGVPGRNFAISHAYRLREGSRAPWAHAGARLAALDGDGNELASPPASVTQGDPLRVGLFAGLSGRAGSTLSMSEFGGGVRFESGNLSPETLGLVLAEVCGFVHRIPGCRRVGTTLGDGVVALAREAHRLVGMRLALENPQHAGPSCVAGEDGSCETLVASFDIPTDGIPHDGRVTLLTDAGRSALTFEVCGASGCGIDLSFGPGPHAGNEGEFAAVTLTLGGALAEDVTVPILATGILGAEASDFSLSAQTATFAAGETSHTLLVHLTDDTDGDNGEHVVLSFGELPAGVRAGSIRSATVEIIDDDHPSIEVGFAVVAEPPVANEGGPPATVTVTLSARPGREVAVPVTVSLPNTVSSDHGEVPGSVVFGPEDTEATFEVAAVDDSEIEGDEGIVLGIGAPLPVGVLDGDPITVTVAFGDNDDQRLVFSAPGVPRVSESDISVAIPVTVSMSLAPAAPGEVAPSEQRFTLSLSGSATHLRDYVIAGALPEVRVGPDTPWTGTLDLFPLNDRVVEGDEHIVIGGSVPQFSTEPATVTLGDDTAEDVAEITIIGDLRVVNEGDTAEFRVLLSRPVDTAVEVPWSVDDPADAEEDSRAGTVTFAPGAQTATIAVAIADDTLSESWELLTVSLGAPVPDLGGRIRVGNPGVGHALINSNDPVLVGFEEPVSPHAAEGTTAEVLLTLSAPPESLGLGPASEGSSADVTVHVTTSGTATPGRDYTVANSVVTISGGAGSPPVPISVEVLEDAESDPGETIVIDIFAHGRGRVVVDPSGGVTLTVAERNRAPAFASGRFARSVQERSGGGTAVGAPVTATDPDGDALSYSLEGSGLFGIGRRNGQITVLAGGDIDYETVQTHTVTVGVTDGKDEVGGGDDSVDARVPVEILVADVTDALLDLGLSYVSPTWSRRESYDGTIQIRWRPSRWLPEHPGLSMELEYKLPAEPATEWRTTNLRYDPEGDAAQMVDLPRRPEGGGHVYEVRWRLRGEDGATRWRLMERVNTFFSNPVAVATGQADAAEGGYVNVVVRIRDAVDSPVTVRYVIDEGTAEAGQVAGAGALARGAAERGGAPVSREEPPGDFADLSNGVVTIPPGSTRATIRIALNDDGLGEPAESFTVRLAAVDIVPGLDAGDQPEVRGLQESRVNIEANGAVVLSLGGPNDPDLLEGGSAEFSVAVTGEPAGSPLTVALEAGSGTAIPGADFTIPSSVVVPAGMGTATFTVAALEDGADDAGETVLIRLAGAPGAGFLVQPEPVEVTVTERNSPPAFWLADPLTVAVDEGGAIIGSPIRAIDPDGDTLTYSLADLGSAGQFEIDPGTGQITRTGVGGLDFETAAFHTLAVLVDDGKDDRGIAIDPESDEEPDDRTTVVVAVADVDEPPPTPVNVSAVPVAGDGHRNLTLSWDDIAGIGPPVTGHEIEAVADGSPARIVVIAPGQGRTFGSLRPGTEHTLRVRTLNDEGAGGWSTPATAATEPGYTVSVSSVRPRWSEGETAEVQLDMRTGIARVRYEVRHIDTDASDFSGPVAGTEMARASESGTVAVSLNADGLPEGPEVFMISLTGVESPDGRAVLGDVTEIPVTIGGHGPAFSLAGPSDGRMPRGGSVMLTVSSVGDPLAEIVTVTVGIFPAALGQELSAESVAVGPSQTSTTLGLAAGADMAPGVELTVSLSTTEPGMGTGTPLTLTVVAPNPQPAFSDFASGAVELTVREDIEPGSTIGDPVAAADDNDDPTHTLAGGGGLFEIDAGGQVRLARGASLDHEASAAHVLVVEARDHKSDIGLPDSAVDDRISMTVAVSDLPEPPLAPAGVTARSADVLGDSRLAVGWAAPDNTGRPEITGYDIEHRRAGEGDGAYTAANVIHRGTDISATIFGLDADTGYEVRVRARNDEDTAGGEVVAQWSPPAAGATRGGLDARVALRAAGSDDRFSHTDALLIFYSLRFGNFLRANERLLDLVYGRLMAGVSVATRQNRDIIARSEEFAAVAGHSEFDMDRNGTFDHVDALLIFYSLRFGDFLEANPRLLQLVYGRVTSGRLATLREMLEVIARSEALRQGEG